MLIEFGIPIKPVRLMLMSLNETYNTIRDGKHLADAFPINPLALEMDI